MTLHVNGATYTASDRARLARQYDRVYSVMSDGEWRTLRDISSYTSSPEASVSARLRDARKDGNIVLRRRVPGGNGLHEYKLLTGAVAL